MILIIAEWIAQNKGIDMSARYIVAQTVLLVMLIACAAYADDDTLRDLGPVAASGEVPKWTGTEWVPAHDDVGVASITVGPGLIVSNNSGHIFMVIPFVGSGATNAAARIDHVHEWVSAWSGAGLGGIHDHSSSTQGGYMVGPPIGSVTAWLKSLPATPELPVGWVECNGQILDDTGSVFHQAAIPNLNGHTNAMNGEIHRVGFSTNPERAFDLDSGTFAFHEQSSVGSIYIGKTFDERHVEAVYIKYNISNYNSLQAALQVKTGGVWGTVLIMPSNPDQVVLLGRAVEGIRILFDVGSTINRIFNIRRLDLCGAPSFLMGNQISGEVGGVDSHSLNTDLVDSGPSFRCVRSSVSYVTLDNKPPYHSVVWIMRVK